MSGCGASVCRMHSKQDSQERQFVSDDNKGICSESTKISACDSSQLDDCGYSLVSVDSQNRSRSPTNTVTSSEFVTNPGLLKEESERSHVSLPVTTAAGDSTVLLQRDFRTDSTDFQLPLHVLLNGQYGLLKRNKGSLLYVAARHKRILENITATSPPTLSLCFSRKPCCFRPSFGTKTQTAVILVQYLLPCIMIRSKTNCSVSQV